MPPKAVKTIRDLIYWQQAKIIHESADFGKKRFALVKILGGNMNERGNIESRVL
nr:hypothetical protein [Candidatus Njordarchaeota archaeon]